MTSIAEKIEQTIKLLEDIRAELNAVPATPPTLCGEPYECKISDIGTVTCDRPSGHSGIEHRAELSGGSYLTWVSQPLPDVLIDCDGDEWFPGGDGLYRFHLLSRTFEELGDGFGPLTPAS